MRVAVVDCGTNTIRLLVAEADSTGLRPIERQLRYVRLGQGVDASGRFAPEALARTLAAVEEYAQSIRDHRVDRVRFLATSAARDVANRDQFLAGVEIRMGVAAEVISGQEEARLSFLGALSGGPVSGPVLVSDIGGGSTELILGLVSPDVTIQTACSLDLGSVRLRERCLTGDPPSAAQLQAARDLVDQTLDASGLAWTQARSWIGVAGTVTSIAALLAGLTHYDRAVVHNSVVQPSDLAGLAERLSRLDQAGIRRLYPLLEPMRAEVITAGALIADGLARRVHRPLIVRETDILDGAAMDLIRSDD
ncbi:MAG: Ppx/GppA family phosphatase [Propionibacteriaceae bacterium]|jgi:exopolyphosphatase/guanosine-5'-triphosphate,3'-diphosphate pyrophosphatase|nr:Ppx/GppA family phosphatase [Propionibacteriaceae bacterium]